MPSVPELTARERQSRRPSWFATACQREVAPNIAPKSKALARNGTFDLNPGEQSRWRSSGVGFRHGQQAGGLASSFPLLATKLRPSFRCDVTAYCHKECTKTPRNKTLLSDSLSVVINQRINSHMVSEKL